VFNNPREETLESRCSVGRRPRRLVLVPPYIWLMLCDSQSTSSQPAVRLCSTPSVRRDTLRSPLIASMSVRRGSDRLGSPDFHGSGASWSNPVGVRIPPSAPPQKQPRRIGGFCSSADILSTNCRPSL